ncbi:MAG: spore germination protein [Turicibacter sp.]|nr:spore germination protein [Turicibacter sp.]
MGIFKDFKETLDEYHPIKENSTPLNYKLDDNLEEIKRTLGNVNDLLCRELKLKGAGGVKVAVLGIDGLINSDLAQHYIIHVMAVDLSMVEEDSLVKNQDAFDAIFNSRISMIDAKTSKLKEDLYRNLLNGHVIVLVDGVCSFMMFDCKGWQTRSIGEPDVESSLRGPKDCFVETIRFNTATLRRRLKDPRLRFDTHIIGRSSKTDVFVAYIEGLTNEKFVQIANQRLEELDVDGIQNTAQLMQYIEDQHHTIIPRLFETERPDMVVSGMLAGQVAIFVDGSPFVVLTPFFFTGIFSTMDDYYNHPLFASLKRVMRYICALIVILAPAFYVSVSTFHQEMIPTAFLIIMMNQRESNPFSTFFEMFLVYALFEIMREASLRKPNALGNAMSIVGSLIVGQSLVEAGLVSYAAIIIGSITTLTTYVLAHTRISEATRILTLVFMIIGGWLGFYGITVGFIVLIIHLCSLTTFGEPFMSSLAPMNLMDQVDQILRLPLRWMKQRPFAFDSHNRVRQNLQPKMEDDTNEG